MNDLSVRSDSRVSANAGSTRSGSAAGTVDAAGVSAAATRDFPVPPRSVRVGLSAQRSATESAVRRTAAAHDPAARVSIAQSSGTRTSSTPMLTVKDLTERVGAAETTLDTPVVVTAGELTGTATAGEAEIEATTPEEPPVPTKPRGGKRAKHAVSPPAAIRTRAALVAVAAGAGAVAISGSVSDDGTAAQAPAQSPAQAPTPALAAGSTDIGGGVTAADSRADMSGFTSQLSAGKTLAAQRKAAENAKKAPLFSPPLTGNYSFTSGFGGRWGSFHGGLDLAAPLGTPIHSVSDGVVVEAGPASGYGNWVQVKMSDGTIVMYGHMASSGVLVHEGQKVTAGDVIALVGSEGFSTGPHVHLEVWKHGMKTDPAPWLASKGIRLKAYTG